MYAATYAIAVAPLLATITASPVSEEARRSAIVRRDAPSTAEVKWTNPTGGNLQLGYADQGLHFGTTKPSDIIRNQIASTCATIGTCVGGNDVELPDHASYIDDGFLDSLQLGYNVDGAYPESSHNGLIDMLAWAIDNQTTTTNTCYSPYATSSCNFMSYCPEPQKSCMDQYTAPGAVAVVLDNPDGGNSAPGFITVQFSSQKVGDDGLCDKLFSLGSGIAGFMGEAGGPAGGIFTLGSLFCQD